MELTTEEKAGLNTALNEASWLAMKIDEGSRRATLLMDVLTLPADGPAPTDSTVTLELRELSRIVGSYRRGLWNDPDADVLPLTVRELEVVIHDCGACPVYGWEFLDPPEENWSDWRHRLSLDIALSPAPGAHVLELFQETRQGQLHHLDVRFWFDELRILDPNDEEMALADFIRGGIRWWDAMYAGDPRTASSGIVPGGAIESKA
ncbi:hypothetical protein [Nonomuraea dietziae]|uniref:hypothetical protein n=1 Tax=Nonomuraea dietziae TaxID=65515 RepID=UPI0033C8EE83